MSAFLNITRMSKHRLTSTEEDAPVKPAPRKDAGMMVTHEIPYSAELSRKALHLAALVVPLFMGIAGKESLWLLAPLALLAAACDLLRAKSESFARFIGLAFGYMMRRDEIPPVGGPVILNGATWVLVTAALLGLVFPISVAVPAFVMFMIADAMAALIGRRFGRNRWPGTSRTVEGSAAFAATGLLIMAFMPGVPFWAGAVAVLLATAAEAARLPLNDNIAVPFLAAAVLFALERFVLGMNVVLFW